MNNNKKKLEESPDINVTQIGLSWVIAQSPAITDASADGNLSEISWE